MLNFVATTAFTFWVAALRTRLSRCGHAWGRCSALQAVACCVIAPTQTRPQRPTRARPTAVSRLNRRQVGALAGVAPYNHDSGRFKSRRCISVGRAALRTVLCMATLAATRFLPHHSRVLSAALGCRESKKSGFGCMHAQTADPPECHRQIRYTVKRNNERNGGRKCLTFNTVACSLDFLTLTPYLSQAFLPEDSGSAHLRA